MLWPGEDEALWSPRRIVRAIRLFLYLIWPSAGRPQVWVPFGHIVRFHRRPWAEEEWRRGQDHH